MKGICLLCQNIARSCSYGLVPCHGAVALGFLMCGWNVAGIVDVQTHVGLVLYIIPGWLQCLLGIMNLIVGLYLPSPVLEVPKSKSSLVTFWESRYVAGTHPCSSAVLTNHHPVEGETEQSSEKLKCGCLLHQAAARQQ